ncbi:hypothetical protein SAMN02745947_05341 [Rhodococcus rhodochrous J3]|uniref:Uncharacterized protein n=1 Tax=Rhodococcus rhodochrous J3 TaxID=903528 RepID=A0ABY1MIS0_RHORH|nr:MULTISPECIES: hypothetical protein [Nocardiaceae]SMG58879.1 hypothetical protein SAMN02745947_05341 [Rhodococcus rhodochrous J3]
MTFGHEARQRSGDDAGEDAVGRLDDGDRRSPFRRGGGDLEADESAADHHHVTGPVEFCSDRRSVVDRAQRQHPG